MSTSVNSLTFYRELRSKKFYKEGNLVKWIPNTTFKAIDDLEKVHKLPPRPRNVGNRIKSVNLIKTPRPYVQMPPPMLSFPTVKTEMEHYGKLLQNETYFNFI